MGSGNQRKLKKVIKAWHDSQNTNYWFIELECGHVLHRPIPEPFLPTQKAVCEYCIESSEPDHTIPESIK